MAAAGFIESRDMFMGKKRCMERARTWVGEDGLLDSIALEGCQEQFARQIMITIRKKKESKILAVLVRNASFSAGDDGCVSSKSFGRAYEPTTRSDVRYHSFEHAYRANPWTKSEHFHAQR